MLSEAAIDSNYAMAQDYLGLCYLYGYIVGVDEKRAAELFSVAASQGDIFGQSNLGHMYLHGTGVPKDTAMAESWLSKAGEGGHSGAKERARMIRGEVYGGGVNSELAGYGHLAG